MSIYPIRFIPTMRFWLVVTASLMVLVTASANATPSPRAGARTKLGISGSQFTVNGKPTFLFGISYYGGLGASRDFVRRDLADMKRFGINWIRVWATWNAYGNDVSAVGPDGAAREPYLSRLKWLVEECDRRGVVVDVTLTRSDKSSEKEVQRPFAAHRRAVSTIVTALKPYRNWYIDLANERNQPGRSVYTSMEELIELRRVVKLIDDARLVTASHAVDMDREELRRYLVDVNLDFVCPHRPRDANSPGQTEAKTREYLAWMKELGVVRPVHYQEPFRRGWGTWQPVAEDYVADWKGARDGGTAGWCLHNGGKKDRKDGESRRSFDMRVKRLFDQLDEQEMGALEEIKHLPRG